MQRGNRAACRRRRNGHPQRGLARRPAQPFNRAYEHVTRSWACFGYPGRAWPPGSPGSGDLAICLSPTKQPIQAPLFQRPPVTESQ